MGENRGKAGKIEAKTEVSVGGLLNQFDKLSIMRNNLMRSLQAKLAGGKLGQQISLDSSS